MEAMPAPPATSLVPRERLALGVGPPAPAALLALSHVTTSLDSAAASPTGQGASAMSRVRQHTRAPACTLPGVIAGRGLCVLAYYTSHTRTCAHTHTHTVLVSPTPLAEGPQPQLPAVAVAVPVVAVLIIVAVVIIVVIATMVWRKSKKSQVRTRAPAGLVSH